MTVDNDSLRQRIVANAAHASWKAAGARLPADDLARIEQRLAALERLGGAADGLLFEDRRHDGSRQQQAHSGVEGA